MFFLKILCILSGKHTGLEGGFQDLKAVCIPK